MRILVTGASGFIGKHLLPKLLCDPSNQILALTHTQKLDCSFSNLDVLSADLTNISIQSESIFSFDPHVIIHLAWLGIPHFSPDSSFQNILYSYNLFRSFSSINSLRKVIVTGSCAEYGSPGLCIETNLPSPVTNLGLSKHITHNLLKELLTTTNIDLIWFRPFYIYGPSQRTGSLIPHLVNTFRNDLDLVLTNPFNSFDYIYIDDVIQAIYSAVNLPLSSSTVFNIGSGSPTPTWRVSQLVELAVKGTTTSTDAYISTFDQQPPFSFWASTQHSKSSLNLTQPVDLLSGITAYLEQTHV